MYVGAAISVVVIAVSALAPGLSSVRTSDPFSAVIQVILWVLLIFQVRKGTDWARIVAIVWSVIRVLSAVVALTLRSPSPPAYFAVLVVLRAVVGAVVAVLLLRPESRAFSAERSSSDRHR